MDFEAANRIQQNIDCLNDTLNFQYLYSIVINFTMNYTW